MTKQKPKTQTKSARKTPAKRPRVATKGRVVVACVIDRSSSMFPVKEQVISGFNAFMEEQKKQPGDATIQITLFDTHVEQPVMYSIKSVPLLTPETYQPNGMTALLDATGETMRLLLDEYGKSDRVIVLIITDGQENASCDYTRENVRRLIEQGKKYDWEFVYIGANSSAFAEAKSIGVPQATTGTYTANADGTRVLYANVSSNVSLMRSGVVGASMSWTTGTKDDDE